ncbi:MAG TPA: 23S rRNA (pseudouridine(1915)-N(3))-methyltransferase RlmH [Burkholderiales bacterium]|nr:23S rRNA (pseudouridine(1915)-N(3))-methyltransferase RlmH [Burkholderiales bacterium]
MKFYVLAIGHRMPGWVAAGFEDYVRRMPPEMPIILREIRPEPRHAPSLSLAALQRIVRAEAGRLAMAQPSGSVLVALDERGKPYRTAQFAEAIGSWRNEGHDVAFAIGGADGLDEAFKRSAQLMLSLSPMTLPHQLVRVMLAEQIYRAVSILNKHPYHRA